MFWVLSLNLLWHRKFLNKYIQYLYIRYDVSLTIKLDIGSSVLSKPWTGSIPIPVEFNIKSKINQEEHVIS